MIIIFCPNCGNQINDNEKFCSKCGNQIKQDSQDNNEQMKQSEKTTRDNISQNVDTEKNYTKYKRIVLVKIFTCKKSSTRVHF